MWSADLQLSDFQRLPDLHEARDFVGLSLTDLQLRKSPTNTYSLNLRASVRLASASVGLCVIDEMAHIGRIPQSAKSTYPWP
jgi:hypothetical protein